MERQRQTDKPVAIARTDQIHNSPDKHVHLLPDVHTEILAADQQLPFLQTWDMPA